MHFTLSSQPIYSVATLREIESRHAGESPSLMERAGAAADARRH
jgi:hypothetical protein